MEICFQFGFLFILALNIEKFWRIISIANCKCVSSKAFKFKTFTTLILLGLVIMIIITFLSRLYSVLASLQHHHEFYHLEVEWHETSIEAKKKNIQIWEFYLSFIFISQRGRNFGTCVLYANHFKFTLCKTREQTHFFVSFFQLSVRHDKDIW